MPAAGVKCGRACFTPGRGPVAQREHAGRARRRPPAQARSDRRGRRPRGQHAEKQRQPGDELDHRLLPREQQGSGQHRQRVEKTATESLGDTPAHERRPAPTRRRLRPSAGPRIACANAVASFRRRSPVSASSSLSSASTDSLSRLSPALATATAVSGLPETRRDDVSRGACGTGPAAATAVSRAAGRPRRAARGGARRAGGRRRAGHPAAARLAATVHDDAHVVTAGVDPAEQVEQPLPRRTGDDQLSDGGLLRGASPPRVRSCSLLPTVARAGHQRPCLRAPRGYARRRAPRNGRPCCAVRGLDRCSREDARTRGGARAGRGSGGRAAPTPTAVTSPTKAAGGPGWARPPRRVCAT